MSCKFDNAILSTLQRRFGMPSVLKNDIFNMYHKMMHMFFENDVMGSAIKERFLKAGKNTEVESFPIPMPLNLKGKYQRNEIVYTPSNNSLYLDLTDKSGNRCILILSARDKDIRSVDGLINDERVSSRKMFKDHPELVLTGMEYLTQRLPVLKDKQSRTRIMSNYDEEAAYQHSLSFQPV